MFAEGEEMYLQGKREHAAFPGQGTDISQALRMSPVNWGSRVCSAS